MSKTRGCGSRVKGGIYAETMLGPGGTPIEAFLVEPPRPVPDDLGISPIGVKLVEIDGAFHVFDWVGSEHYPHVADFVQELKAMGLSRRLPKTLDFSKLGPESRMFLIHSEAIVAGWEKVQKRDADDWVCPKGEHTTPGMCIATWWHDIPGDDLTAISSVGEPPEKTEAYGLRSPAGDTPPYRAWPRHEEAGPRGAGIFAIMPIGQVSVIHDPEDQEHIEAMAKASAASIPVAAESE